MDIATVLEEYLADVAPLPADLAFILDEIRVKDQKLLEAQRRIQQRDGPIQRHVKTSGALAEYPKEQAAYPRIRSDFQECLLLQKEKARLATMGLFLMSKHVSKLDRQVAQLEAEGVLAPAVLTPEEPSVYQSDPDPAPRPRKTSMAERRASRPEPRRQPSVEASLSPAASRHSTPAADPARAPAIRHNSQSGRDAIEANGVRISMKRGQSSPRQRPPLSEEPNEAFCFCKKGSVGNMIACDGDDCDIEWFHWKCVGLTEDPKGSWYCPDCRAKIKRIKT